MGGWHHANHATPGFFPKTGYCFVNHIVLPIQRLSNNFKQVLYVDVHHGDGMEKAFAATDRVLTPSHHATPGFFFPGTGKVEDVGSGRTTCTRRSRRKRCWSSGRSLTRTPWSSRRGAKGLNEGPIKVLNFTPISLISVLKFVLQRWEIPTLVLGEGDTTK